MLIDGNMLLVNTIPMVQGIFLDDGSYNKITIQNNIIYTGMTHGVTVTDGSQITVRNNTLLNTPGEGHNGSLIMVPGGSVVENNISTSYPRRRRDLAAATWSSRTRTRAAPTTSTTTS